MAAIPEKGELSVEDCIKKLMAMDGSLGCIVFNQDGIPLKRVGSDIDSTKAIQIAALTQDFVNSTKKVLTKELHYVDQELEIIRIRTKAYTEMIITQCSSQQGDFTLVCFQQCDPVKIDKMRQQRKLQEQKETKKKDKKGKMSKEKEREEN